MQSYYLNGKIYKNLLRLSKVKYPRVGYNKFFGLVFARYGRLYATNSVNLVTLDVNGFTQIANESWKTVDIDYDSGELSFSECELNLSNDIFERFFDNVKKLEYDSSQLFDPEVIMNALKIFGACGIKSVNMGCNGTWIEYTGHNALYSVRSLLIGQGCPYDVNRNLC